VVPDRPEPLIDGEEWATTRQDDAAHWLSVYDQMVALHEHMLRQLPNTPAELVGERRALIEGSLARLAARRRYWHDCCLTLADVVYDAPHHQLTIGDRSAVFTMREAQLLELFLQHPNHAFSSRQLIQQAWNDEDLSEEQIRTYVVRIRHKLRSLHLRGELKSVSRSGYALELHD
jgi:DNA-binding response OmpR family regulator